MKTNKVNKQKSVGQRVVYGIAFAYLCLHCLSLIYPLIWLIISSFKDSYEYMIANPFALPEKFLFHNYVEAFELIKVRGTTFFGLLFNSIWWSVGNTFLNLFMSALVAYVMAKYDFGAHKYIYAIIIMIMVVPIYGSGAAAYKLAVDLNIINSPLLLIKSLGGYSGFNFLVLFSFFKSIAWSYAEAAFMDGAGHFKVYLQVMLPMALAPVFSLALVVWIGIWNGYMEPLVYLYDYPTLATGLYVYEKDMTRAINYPVYFAGVTMCLAPVITLFICSQDVIMNSISTGGLKG